MSTSLQQNIFLVMKIFVTKCHVFVAYDIWRWNCIPGRQKSSQRKISLPKGLTNFKKTKLLVCLIDTIAIVAIVLFFLFLFLSHWFVLFFFLLNIYMSWHIYCYTYTTNFTILSQLLRRQFFIGQNKIIKYETVTNDDWKYMFCENVVTFIVWMCQSYSTF